MGSVDNPFINTKLSTTVSLRPDQMDNKIYLNLKNNLEKKIVGKCYKDYGFINKIYEIIRYKDGIIEDENFTGSAVFDLEFSCSICRPLRNQSIVCQVEKVNKMLIMLKNGPLKIVITIQRFDNENFFVDNNNNIRYKNKNGSEILKSDDYVIANVLQVIFNHGDSRITAMGSLNRMATEDDVKKFYTDMYEEPQELVSYTEYVNTVQELVPE